MVASGACLNHSHVECRLQTASLVCVSVLHMHKGMVEVLNGSEVTDDYFPPYLSIIIASKMLTKQRNRFVLGNVVQSPQHFAHLQIPDTSRALISEVIVNNAGGTLDDVSAMGLMCQSSATGLKLG